MRNLIVRQRIDWKYIQNEELLLNYFLFWISFRRKAKKQSVITKSVLPTFKILKQKITFAWNSKSSEQFSEWKIIIFFSFPNFFPQMKICEWKIIVATFESSYTKNLSYCVHPFFFVINQTELLFCEKKFF